jgi:hypothetical protein
MTVTSHEIPQKNRHENVDANLAAMFFSWGWPSQWTLMKIIRGGELSRKCVFRESNTVRVDAWRCTLTNYFRESKTIFRDLFCPLTKYLDSGSGCYDVIKILIILIIMNYHQALWHKCTSCFIYSMSMLHMWCFKCCKCYVSYVAYVMIYKFHEMMLMIVIKFNFWLINK